MARGRVPLSRQKLPLWSDKMQAYGKESLIFQHFSFGLSFALLWAESSVFERAEPNMQLDLAQILNAVQGGKPAGSAASVPGLEGLLAPAPQGDFSTLLQSSLSGTIGVEELAALTADMKSATEATEAITAQQAPAFVHQAGLKIRIESNAEMALGEAVPAPESTPEDDAANATNPPVLLHQPAPVPQDFTSEVPIDPTQITAATAETGADIAAAQQQQALQAATQTVATPTATVASAEKSAVPTPLAALAQDADSTTRPQPLSPSAYQAPAAAADKTALNPAAQNQEQGQGQSQNQGQPQIQGQPSTAQNLLLQASSMAAFAEMLSGQGTGQNTPLPAVQQNTPALAQILATDSNDSSALGVVRPFSEPSAAQQIQFAQMLGQKPGTLPHPAAEMVRLSITRAAAEGIQNMTLHLKPAELGRVEIRMEFSIDGRVQAHVIAERPETLNLLRADTRGLEQALQNAGYDNQRADLSFDLRGQDRQHNDDGEAALTHMDDMNNDFTETGLDLALLPHGFMPDGRLDLHV